MDGFDDFVGREVAFDDERRLLVLDGVRLHTGDGFDGGFDGVGAAHAAIVDVGDFEFLHVAFFEGDRFEFDFIIVDRAVKARGGDRVERFLQYLRIAGGDECRVVFFAGRAFDAGDFGDGFFDGGRAAFATEVHVGDCYRERGRLRLQC